LRVARLLRVRLLRVRRLGRRGRIARLLGVTALLGIRLLRVSALLLIVLRVLLIRVGHGSVLSLERGPGIQFYVGLSCYGVAYSNIPVRDRDHAAGAPRAG